MTGPATILRPRVRYFTPGTWVLTAVALAGAASLLYRFVFGLGASTNLSNAYPWGIWIAIDVATGVALAAGGFTTAFLAHVVHRGEYRAIVRPALLTAMLGYTFVALGVMTDLGRFWAIWHVMLPWMWQPDSVLFEVAVCVMTYLGVLYIEFVPVVCERFIGRVRLPGPLAALNRPVDTLLRAVNRGVGRVMTVFIVLGVLLSCMHQSSLGSLMIIAGPKLHPLWQTPMLPLMFLLSAFAVGYPMVIFESLLASRSFRLAPERRVLSRLARCIPILLGLYLAAKVIDLANRGAWVHLLEGSLEGTLFVAEIGLGVVLPFAIFASRLRNSTGWLMTGAVLVILGVVLNRLDVFLIAYAPVGGGAYVPAWTEVAVTAGFIAMIVLLYRFFVLNFPVLPHMTPEPVRPAPLAARPEPRPTPQLVAVAGDAAVCFASRPGRRPEERKP